jgi:hypothetical protein
MTSILRFFLRVALLLAGMVFLASLLVAALLMLALWLLRALWARMIGRPVAPWTFKVDRRAVWDRLYRVPARGPTGRCDDADVIDVQAKEKLR